jgi:heme/copper-type cytochrome/quinol oxidase subunit 4
MRNSVLVSVWLYTMVAVLAEVYTSQNVTNSLTAASAIIAFAISQAAAVVIFYMDIKDEPGSLLLMVLIPVMFLAGLLISVVASLG